MFSHRKTSFVCAIVFLSIFLCSCKQTAEADLKADGTVSLTITKELYEAISQTALQRWGGRDF